MEYPFFIGPSYTSQSSNVDAERCVNMYLEVSEAPGAKVKYALYPTPGIDEAGVLPTYPCRGLLEVNGRKFGVYGAVLYEILTIVPFAYVVRGTVAVDSSPATLCSNGAAGHQLFITSGGKGYIYDLVSNAFSNVINDVVQGGFLDGYFLALDATTSSLYVSDLLDGTVWDPLQFAQRNTAADNWTSFIITHREVWLFGSQTSEVWYDAGAFPYPLQPIPGAFIEQGTAARFSCANVDSTAVWLGQSKDGRVVVWRNAGYTPARISTHATEYAMSQYSTVSDAISWTYQDQGHYFYVLTFPTADHTWVYDTTTQLWHERGYWDSTTPDFTAQPNAFHAMMDGYHITGGTEDGDFYIQSVTSSNDHNGATIRRLRRATHISNEQQQMFYGYAQLDMESGLGAVVLPGDDPKVMLRVSDDGGHTFANERWADGGKIGAFKARVIWRRMGRSRDRVWEVSFSEPIPWRLVNFYMSIEPGIS